MAVPYTAVSGSAPLAAAIALWMIGGGVAAAVLVELIMQPFNGPLMQGPAKSIAAL